GVFHDSILDLKAISIGAVFFGAFTYIGNGPNFMVKSIAEQIGLKMPSFFGYIIRFSIPFLLPLLFITWLIFFAFT
ncbi:MAG: sodium:proton antiporter, partial [Fulvivirga sp.]